MRIPPFDPTSLNPEVRTLHDSMAADEDQYFSGFVAKREDGALLGPFPPLLRYPHFGQPAWAYVKALIEHSSLPKPVREIAILVTGTAFSARYEIYAHERVAAEAGLTPAQIATITAGQRPSDLGTPEAAAYDAAASLTRGESLSASVWEALCSIFGEEGAAELAFLVAGYCMLSVVLNAFDVPVPVEDAR